MLKESENILKKVILEYDNKTVQEQILNSTSGNTELDEVTRNLLTALKNNKSLSVKISVDGEQFNDSTSREVIEKLTKKNKIASNEKSQKIYLGIKDELIETIGKIKFSVYHYNKSAVDCYPKQILESDGVTDQIRSDMDSKQYYEIHFANVNPIIVRDMISSIILSIIYIVICSSAVVLLIFNVDKSRKLMQQKDNFTNNMTHEFKTPMSTIYAAIEALDTYDVLEDKEMTREYLGMMKLDLDRLINMTDSILFNAKMSEGEVALNLEKTNLVSFVSTISNNLKHVLEKKGAQINITSSNDELFVMADFEHFGNVFRNLIDNSIKYSKEDAMITIKLSREGQSAKILFSDEGIGIPNKYKLEIFKPYFRVQENDVYTVKGYGLGLSYIKQIILLHSGKIELVDTSTNKGTTFEILIPLAHE
ncbi:HAMP domain-containing sensor histidine kinase [Flavobacterium sp.]|uniref:sensor histidine kinase n=1 Tax=Flavobacterium sp. TaxID=239 RepID=UPI002B4B9135|nr:HAMP domain-containing sensor histidine kinase [Flavobacterium sp.]HLP64701.1 HAMP domain-containing sensor histidine kinase [Flavobacterium sp.]